MNPRFILSDLKLSIRQWLRSKGTVFWTLLFPILLILIFGAIFSGADDFEYSIIVQNLDGDDLTGFSEGFIENLSKVTILNIDEIEKEKDIKKYMRDEDIPIALIIPEGFGNNIYEFFASQQNPEIPFDNESLPFNLKLYVDPSDQTTITVVRNIITSIIYELNMEMIEGEGVIGIEEENTLGEDFEFIDYFVPGMIGFTIMTSCVYGSIERNTKFRKDGILRKLLTMPVTRAEWILSKMLFMLFLSFLSTLVIIIVGSLVWGLNIYINIFFFVIIIATSFMFSGIGMIIGRFVKEEETADVAGGAITFPMMFLAGTFFPLEQMPDFLQLTAQALPLYYVNEGLRNAMIYADFDKTIYFSAFVLVFALIFFIAGVFLTKWKED